ncbi:MAG: cation-translocating P-type ATPase [Microgenomates group bacterium]|jgi:Cd2+/Zn2+-exporting ATPase
MNNVNQIANKPNLPSFLKEKKFRWLLIALIAVIPLEILSIFSIHLPLWVELPLFISIILIFGRNVFRDGIQSLLHFNFANINLLMTIAIFGAIYLQEFEEATIIVILFALGNALEEFGIERSQTALKQLVDKAPKSGQVKGKNERTPIEQIGVGDILIIKPFDHIPLDGEVVKGDSIVDETAITGEPLPKNKHLGDSVYAGTVNGNSYLEIRVTKTAKDTTLAKIIDLTYKSAEKKSNTQRFIEKFATYYTPAVIFIAILLVVIPVVVFKQPFNRWFVEALTLLLISCPCALVISTPITIFSAMGNATRRGVLIKGGRFLEEIGKIKAIAFDKTRTLTKGEPVVSDIVPFNGFTKEELLSDVAGMEVLSEHPLGKSIVQKAKQDNLMPHHFVNFEAIMGKGVKGECAVCVDKHHCLGNLKFITEEHHVDEAVVKKVEEFEKEGKTAIVLVDNKKVSGVIGITDEIRSESRPTIDSLLRLNVTPVILTGDNQSSARYVAQKVGINIVKAGLLPEGKVKELLTLVDHYKHVAMVGDGVNDAPALASSSVGIAMGAIGSDVAVENSDIALMNNDLLTIPYLIELGKKATTTIRFNITSAVLVKFIFLFLAIAGRSNLTLAIFSDVGVTLFVVLNGLRLYNYKPKV